MGYNPETDHRRSIRLRDYDYSGVGAYFVTICVHGRECLLGGIRDGEMSLNAAGQMVAAMWRELHNKFPTIELDTFVIMPNHFHGIIVFVGAPLCGCPDLDGSTSIKGRPHRAAPTLGDAMDWFKTMTTNAYIRGVKECGWSPFPGRLWQRNYYERVIRDDAELAGIREYIRNNPANWADDEEYQP
ncbi:putative protein [Geobacter sp. OR-1]|uniref:transposase n=1 Tax=Geobacter sp. OR-1 TaxID=1266765 RepID=UPI0005431499|nr:transposase [Geobacter sp. OR-1]GAM10690.1 putative protein [Geobacter sp. OR-1]